MGIQKNKPKKSSARSAEPERATPPAESSAEAGSAILHMQVAERAFLIWLAEGRPHGQDLANWYEAEAQLRGGD
jgi:hypothetical protein